MAFHEHNLLPFSTPQSYALLSAESKATEAANNEERLVVCHYIVWCRTIFVLARVQEGKIRFAILSVVFEIAECTIACA